MSKLAKISKILGSVLEHFTRSQELTLQGGDGEEDRGRFWTHC